MHPDASQCLISIAYTSSCFRYEHLLNHNVIVIAQEEGEEEEGHGFISIRAFRQVLLSERYYNFQHIYIFKGRSLALLLFA